ncbi:MAG: PPC domain-containing DNA-binding protein [Cyanobacteriota bacterium]|nr:PPC domain-containing DNA-binding protein [Cyanobacteriota bacterium]
MVKPGWRLGEGRTTGAGSSSASAYPAPSPSESVQIFVLRLHPHQDLKAELLKFIQQEGIQAGFMLTSVGSLRQATLRMAGATTNQVWRDTFEIVSLVGTLAPSGVHLHLLITDPSGQVRGGHLQAGCLIYTTAEMVIGESLRHRFERQRDEQTGYHELRPRFRS